MAVRKQEVSCPLKVIIVDSGSTDSTLDIAFAFQKYLDIEIVHYEGEYLPGRSLNIGLDKVLEYQVNYVGMLSAHCILQGTDALATLMSSLAVNSEIRSAYGRQLPVNFSDPIAWRDMTQLYSSESRTISRHPSLNNAFSMFERSALESHQFDSTVTNLEDVFWAKEELSLGWKILYEARAAVAHYHGPNHQNDPNRLRTSVEVIKNNLSVFDAEIAKIGLDREDFLLLYFTQSMSELSINIDLVKSRHMHVVVYENEIDTIRFCERNKLNYIRRPKSHENLSLYTELAVVHEIILQELGSFAYVLIYDDSLSREIKILGVSDVITMAENIYPDILWPVTRSRDYLLDQSEMGGYDVNESKKDALLIRRGNGTMIKFSSLTNLRNMSYKTYLLDE